MASKLFAFASVTALTGLISAATAAGCSSSENRSSPVDAGQDVKAPREAGPRPVADEPEPEPTCMTTEAIDATQRSSVHYYQRPGDDLEYDPTKTDLTGYGLSIGLNKIGGGITRFWTGGWYKSPGLEINDIGFMSSVNSMGWSNWFDLVFQEPKWFYRRWQINFNQWSKFTSDGTNTDQNCPTTPPARSFGRSVCSVPCSVSMPSTPEPCDSRRSHGRSLWPSMTGKARASRVMPSTLPPGQ